MDWQDRSRRLIGGDGVNALGKARAMVVGLGGVGSFCAEALARSGVGALTIIDCDRIEDTNINRQLPASRVTVGRLKTEVVGERLLAINPDLRLRSLAIRVHAGNIGVVIDSGSAGKTGDEGEAGEACVAVEAPPDFIADAIDDLPAKVALAVAARERGIKLISSMGAGFRLDPSMLSIDDISQTHTCPLARRYRRLLKDAGVTGGVPVVWSKEKPSRARDADMAEEVSSVNMEKSAVSAASNPASMIFVPATAGIMMASYIVRSILTGIGD